MRADAEAFVQRIDAALDLVRMSLDWARALRRLDELNARVEDPTLWDDPKGAEVVMRERRQLIKWALLS
jgi:peptide chain release factor 2